MAELVVSYGRNSCTQMYNVGGLNTELDQTELDWTELNLTELDTDNTEEG